MMNGNQENEDTSGQIIDIKKRVQWSKSGPNTALDAAGELPAKRRQNYQQDDHTL
jgi:hypothetical protein